MQPEQTPPPAPQPSQPPQSPPVPPPTEPPTELHKAGTVISPQGAATTPPPPPPTPPVNVPTTPALNLPPQAPVVPDSPTPPPAQPVTQADFLALAKKDRKPKRLGLIAGVPVVLVLLLAIVHFTGIFPLTPFRTVSYENGKGSTYSVTFYSRYKVEDVSKDEQELGGASKALVAKKGKGGQSPLKLFIQDAKSNERGAGLEGSLKDCGLGKPVAKVYNQAAETDVSVCDIGELVGVSDVMYMAAFTQKDHYIGVLITSEALAKTAGMSSNEEAKKALENAKLDVYKDDIEKIVGSIKLVSD